MFEELTLKHFSLKEGLLKECRKNLYKSDMPGYIIIRNFIDAKNVQYLRNIWQKASASGFFEQFPGKSEIFLGCPNYYNAYTGQTEQFFYYNFLWNKPYEELSYNICIYIQLLKNAIEGRGITDFLYPLFPQASSFRIALTRNGNHIVKPHRDYYDLENHQNHDIARLQATLILSKNSVDYEGRGFVFKTNYGSNVAFDVDVDVNPGDLVLWRYSNEHSVESIKSNPNQLGFLRILFPPEFIHAHKIIKEKPSIIRRMTPSSLKKIIPKPIKEVLKKVVG